MSSSEPPHQPTDGSKPTAAPSATAQPTSTVPATMDTTPDAPVEETWEDIPEDVKNSSAEEIMTRIRLIDNDIKVGGDE